MKPLLKYFFPTPKEDGGLSDIMRSVDIPHVEIELLQEQDIPKMIPLSRYGYFKTAAHRRDLAKTQREHYEQLWLSGVTERIKNE